VKLTSATKITKTESAKRRQIHPGDAITVSGLTGKQGTVAAATVSDAGASGAETTGSTSGSGGGSSVSSLFSGG
jgi:thiamine monophosphate kinase